MQDILSGNLVPVDLHVHTPESTCYKNSGDLDLEGQYIELLKKYNEKGIKVIGITDHNSINGYRSLIQIRKTVLDRIKIWSELGDLEGVREKIEIEKNKLKLFDEVLILPGVEFNAYPGVHLLLIFDPEMDIDIIENFIVSNGYPKDKQGNDKVEISNVSAYDIINKAYDIGGITIASHIDSNKGAYTVLQKETRAQFFKNEKLMAMQVVSLRTINTIKTLYKNKEYKRRKLPAFIRCSDYHNDKDDIENYVTYMKLSDLNFESIKDAIINNIECISFTKELQNDEIIQELVKDENTYTFISLQEKILEDISKTICCILNEGYGTIVIGIDEDKSIVGIKKKKEECDNIIKLILDSYGDSKAFFRYNIEYYDYGNHIVMVINFKSINKTIYSIGGKVYINKDNSISIANPNDLVKIGERNFQSNFKFINEINKKRIKKINTQLDKIKQFEENLNLYRKIINNSLMIRDIAVVTIIDPNLNYKNKIEGFYLGNKEGDTYIIDKYSEPHTEECYLRVSCPVTKLEVDTTKEDIYSGECILILLGGGVHYIDSKDEYKIATDMPVVRLELKEEFKSVYSLKGIVAWLKSPTLLYLLDLAYGTINLIDPRVIFKVPVIMNELTKLNGIVEKQVDSIIKYEEAILENFDEEMHQGTKSLAQLEEKINKHNLCVSKIGYEIELEIKKAIDINDDEYNVIENYIKSKQWENIFTSELEIE